MFVLSIFWAKDVNVGVTYLSLASFWDVALAKATTSSLKCSEKWVTGIPSLDVTPSPPPSWNPSQQKVLNIWSPPRVVVLCVSPEQPSMDRFFHKSDNHVPLWLCLPSCWWCYIGYSPGKMNIRKSPTELWMENEPIWQSLKAQFLEPFSKLPSWIRLSKLVFRSLPLLRQSSFLHYCGSSCAFSGSSSL